MGRRQPVSTWTAEVGAERCKFERVGRRRGAATDRATIAGEGGESGKEEGTDDLRADVTLFPTSCNAACGDTGLPRSQHGRGAA